MTAFPGSCRILVGIEGCHPSVTRYAKSLLVPSRMKAANSSRHPYRQFHSSGNCLYSVPISKVRTPRSSKFSEDRYFKVSDEVSYALKNNQPVVALETTIYTHGFPYPDNVALALDLEEIVRQNGAVPATVGILNGVARVGLSSQEIIALASSAGKPETTNVSRRDLPYVLGMACHLSHPSRPYV